MKTHKTQIYAVFLFVGIPLLYKLVPKNIEPDEDGIYCSEVTYYNPNTGETSDYTLPVEIIDDMVIKIKFPNGGWLDESHFKPQYVLDGTATIVTDKGYSYTIKLKYDGDCD